MSAESLHDPSVDASKEGSIRVVLREPKLSDVREFLEVMGASRQLHRPWVTPPGDAKAFIEYIDKAQGRDFRGLLVCRESDGRIIGVYNLSQIVYGHFRSAYLGYYVAAEFSRRGYMSEAMQHVCKYAFNTLRLHRLEANIQPENVLSIRLVQRNGFEREGYSPRYLKIGNRWRDHERWAIRKEIWRPKS